MVLIVVVVMEVRSKEVRETDIECLKFKRKERRINSQIYGLGERDRGLGEYVGMLVGLFMDLGTGRTGTGEGGRYSLIAYDRIG